MFNVVNTPELMWLMLKKRLHLFSYIESYIKEVSIKVKLLHQKAEVNITNELFSEFKDFCWIGQTA